MPPRKRKQGPDQPLADAGQEQQQPDRTEVARRIQEKLVLLDIAVEERCQAIADAAQEVVESLMQDFKIRLMTGVPKQIREMPWSDYAATRAREPASEAEARVDSMLQEAQEASVQTVAGARTTRTGARPRARAGGDPGAAAPATARAARRGTARKAVPKFDEGDEAAAAAEASPGEGPPAEAGADPESPPAAANTTNNGAQESRPAAKAAAAAEAEARAQAKIDAKLAALGAAAAGRRTVARGALPGEALFSAKGSPLSVLAAGNGSRTRGARAAQIGLTPAPAPANTSAVGCVTLLKRGGPAAGGGAAPRGRGRGRRREVVEPDAAIMITTADGTSFMVDGSASALGSIPDSHRAEVQQHLIMLQRLAATALGGSGSGGAVG